MCWHCSAFVCPLTKCVAIATTFVDGTKCVDDVDMLCSTNVNCKPRLYVYHGRIIHTYTFIYTPTTTTVHSRKTRIFIVLTSVVRFICVFSLTFRSYVSLTYTSRSSDFPCVRSGFLKFKKTFHCIHVPNVNPCL